MALAYDHVPYTTPSPAAPFAPGLDVRAVVAPFGRNEEIYAEEDETKYVYKVISGAVRVTRMVSDGRRSINAFYLPGEVFGCEPGRMHRFAAEAIGECRIAMVRRSAIEAEVDRSAAAGRIMWALAAEDARRLQEHVLLLSRRSAAERVGAFLLELADRGQSRDVIEIPMSRSDIADYLGLTIETVSRTFSQFERDGAIALPSVRRVVLKRRPALTGVL